MHITLDEMKKLPFQFFQKTALLQARQLTDADYQLRNGTIQTREGPVGFEPGDYLARGIQDEEWPITKEHFARSYERVSELDTDGFAFYHATDICQAYQMPESFTLRRSRGDMLTGKAGDYLVQSGERVWIVDHTIFENSYEPLSER